MGFGHCQNGFIEANEGDSVVPFFNKFLETPFEHIKAQFL